METTKTCSKCKEIKDLSEFGKRTKSKDGLQYYCKPCTRARSRACYADPAYKESQSKRYKARWANDSEFREAQLKTQRERYANNSAVRADQKIRHSPESFAWKKEILQRDTSCTVCGSEEDLHTHHLNNWTDFPEQRYDLSNGVGICSECHIGAVDGYHSVCGKKNNTKEQFYEWVERPI